MGTTYKIIKDPVYGYLRVDPIPTKDEVDRYYREEFYSALKSFNDSELKVQEEQKEFFDSRWDQIAKFCNSHFGDLTGLSVFDIGFGYAQALLYFRKKGMRVSGLEPSPEGVAYARSVGLEVFQAGIENLDCAEGNRFDVVTSINVLEHLRSPAEMLAGAREKLLKPNGILVIDVANEFNDFQTAADAEHGLKQWWICPPNHINYFSVTSICALLQHCGYRVLHKVASFPMELFLLMGDIYVGNSEIGKRCQKQRVLFEKTMRRQGQGRKLDDFYQALAGLDLGRQAVIFATPES